MKQSADKQLEVGSGEKNFMVAVNWTGYQLPDAPIN